METIDKLTSVASNERILKIIEEAELELIKIQPEIDYLEQCNKKLKELKEHQLKLNTLIISLKSIANYSDLNNIYPTLQNEDLNKIDVNISQKYINSRKVFLPDQAITQVKNFLRTKNNLNYEIFKAVVFNSGIATTEQIKSYLIENNIQQPKTGKTFDDVELKEISSRTHYLVRKNVLDTTEPGIFKSVPGWCMID